jgi:two-component system cell cycle sensor histidine kinase PleC
VVWVSQGKDPSPDAPSSGLPALAGDQGLLETESYLRNVFHHSPLGICAVAKNGRLMTANPAFERMLGPAPADRAIRTLTDVTHPEDAAAVEGLRARLAAGETDLLAMEKRFQRPDGTAFWGRLTASAVRDQTGTLHHFVAMVEDIDHRRRVDAALEDINEELESLNRAKSVLMSAVSHEFRTALTGIQGFSELLRDEDLEQAEVKELAGDISGESQRLGRLIDDLLDLDQMESGSMPLRHEPVQVNRVLAAVSGRVGRRPSGHRVETRLAAGLPPIDADPDRLTQVFTNLLSNAVKYSPDTSLIVVTSEPVQDGVRVAIRDTGAGIPPDSLERIFDRYTRLEREAGTRVTGTGLGLPIVRQIVSMHGGRVWAQNAPGGGAVFTVELPLRARPKEPDADRVL